MAVPLLTVALATEHDVVLARQRAREIAELLGMDSLEQTRVATAVSEIARNAFEYAVAGKVEFYFNGAAGHQLCIRIADQGRGIRNLPAVLEGRYKSRTGMGLGIMGARRLMDDFEITSSPEAGTTVVLTKLLTTELAQPDRARISAQLARSRPQTVYAEIQQHNQELLQALEDLGKTRDETERLNRELEETNQGVMALYAELDDKALDLQRASELKSRFLSYMSHEFRTPLNSILTLSRILLDRTDGDLNEEQERQVVFIRKSADELSVMVNDLLDLAKIEAGKVDVRTARFELATLFSTLRGMFRPLLTSDTVSLVFEDPVGFPRMLTDEGKVSQILRNFISNALKFTEHGEVRVAACRDGDEVVLTVADTGIGIALGDQERIFQEFAQVESMVQRRVRGTGLGLPLSRKLADLLAGSVSVESEPGRGSTFFLRIPFSHPHATEEDAEDAPRWHVDPDRLPVLVVEDEIETLCLYQRFLEGTRYQAVPTRTLEEARWRLEEIRPLAVILDVMLEHETSWGLLIDLKRDPRTRDVPVFVVTSADEEKKATSLGADRFHRKPAERRWLVDALNALADVDGSGVAPAAPDGSASAAETEE